MTDTEDRIRAHLESLYPDLGPAELDQLTARLIDATQATQATQATGSAGGRGAGLLPGADEVVLITYGDTLVDHADPARPYLQVLEDFLSSDLNEVFSAVHVLPFLESSSDGGFSIIDYRTIAPGLGDWSDLAALAQGRELMVDLVCNHGSARSERFAEFLADREPGRSWFLTVPPGADLSLVVRPRVHDLAVPVETEAGTRYVWATFSSDQIDFDFTNPDVLVEFASIIGFYLDAGATRIRLDAIAYLWKRIGTCCIHLPETHQVVKLFRTLVEAREPEVLLITETNVPHAENISYFGAGDEAQVVYNFTLAPLVVWSLLAGDAAALTKWLVGLAPPPQGCTFLNFLASHDGLGLRPIEDLDGVDLEVLVDAAAQTGGRVSTYSDGDTQRPYELNVSLADLLAGTDGAHADRFVVAHAVMLAIQGIPAIYIHSILATPGDHETLARTGHARDINRAQLGLGETRAAISTGWRGRVFDRLGELIRIRRSRPAFAPAASQIIHALGPSAVAIERVSTEPADRVVAINNLSDQPVQVSAPALAAIFGSPVNPVDLVSGDRLGPGLELAPWQVVWLADQ